MSVCHVCVAVCVSLSVSIVFLYGSCCLNSLWWMDELILLLHAWHPIVVIIFVAYTHTHDASSSCNRTVPKIARKIILNACIGLPTERDPSASVTSDLKALYKCVIIIGRICRRQLCRYCFYSRPIFGFFAPQGRHVVPIKVKFGRKERTEGPLLHAKYHLDRSRDGV